jgi:serine/threonine protein kinase
LAWRRWRTGGRAPAATFDKERADVYGIGSILYELLTGRPPFELRGDERDAERLRGQRLSAPLVDGSGQRIPPGLARVAARALASDPNERYASVDALRHDLEQLVRGGGWLQQRTYEPVRSSCAKASRVKTLSASCCARDELRRSHTRRSALAKRETSTLRGLSGSGAQWSTSTSVDE